MQVAAVAVVPHLLLIVHQRAQVLVMRAVAVMKTTKSDNLRSIDQMRKNLRIRELKLQLKHLKAKDIKRMKVIEEGTNLIIMIVVVMIIDVGLMTETGDQEMIRKRSTILIAITTEEADHDPLVLGIAEDDTLNLKLINFTA